MRRRGQRAHARDRRQGEFLYFEGSKPGVATTSLIPGIVEKSLALAADSEAHALGFGRRGVRAAGALDRLAVRRRRGTRAPDRHRHRPSHPRTSIQSSGQPLALASPADYSRVLSEASVLADFAARRERIRERVAEAGEKLGGHALLDPELLDEVTALCEWPEAVAGDFEARFLELPREVLISTLQVHQRISRWRPAKASCCRISSP